MRFDRFRIKYLPEIFPNVDFTQEFSENFRVIATENLANVVKTSDKWFSVLDTEAINRNIQASINTRYTVEFIADESVDFSLLESCGDVIASTDSGVTMTLFDVEVSKELIENTRNYKITISFTDKGISNRASFLDTKNIKELQLSGQQVNYILYEVAKPAYVQRVTINSQGKFQFPNIEPYSNIEVNDYLYCHSNDFNVNSQNNQLQVVKCYLKDANYIYFQPRNQQNRPTLYNKSVQLDYSPERSADSLVIPRKLEVQILTTLQPKLSIIEPTFSEELTTKGGIKKYTNAITGNLLNCLFYVQNSDLWKIKYINYADLCFFQSGNTVYYADYTADIAKVNERSSLLNLFEVDLRLQYNTISASIEV